MFSLTLLTQYYYNYEKYNTCFTRDPHRYTNTFRHIFIMRNSSNPLGEETFICIRQLSVTKSIFFDSIYNYI